ncbi:MAG TPA: glycosyltransferase [Xanthobacteraceae bacterium]|nr:glycosyltransferase [Xanthobacteraceae bacterium]
MTMFPPEQLPLVSILIINWNYARYLSQSIRSVLAQDYPNIECIIVDNGSTDDSVEVIQAEIAGDPRFRLVRFEANLGQLGAFFTVFGQCKGDFITVLDADDVLFASFVSSHVQVHLALPRPVAFTSSNIMEINSAGRIRSGRYPHFGSDTFWEAPALVDRSLAARIPAVSDADFDRLSVRTCAVPFHQTGWFWSPGSAGMYRRTVLRVVHQVRTPAKYLRPADAYLSPFCHALAGSALIDVSLSLYRIHDSNYFAAHETIAGLKAGRPEFVALQTELAEETTDFLLANSLRFQQLVGLERFWELLDQLTGSMIASKVYRSPAFIVSVVRHLPGLRKAFGDARLARALINRLKTPRLFDLLGKCASSPSNLGFVAQSLGRVIIEPLTGKRRRERLRSLERHRPMRADGYPAKPHDSGPVALISRDPPIFLTAIAFDEWIGIAGAFGRRFGDCPAGFLIYPAWSIEDSGRVAATARAVREHRRRYPSHRLTYLANSLRESSLLAAEGIPCVFLNKNFTVSERIFRPLPDAEPEFDAVYNARFVPEKRHELAAAIEKLAYVTYISDVEDEGRKQIDLMERFIRENPHHALLNPIIGGHPKRFSPTDTNVQINRARIGLCLSAVEGSNRASMEYMLAGLGVVSTPSTGGRDVYFDPEFCIVCEPDAEAVRDAVARLKARNIPRDHIRRATLRRVETERRRFLDLVEDLRVRLGGKPGQKMDWSAFADMGGLASWNTFDAHLEEFEREEKSAELKAQSWALAELTAFEQTGIQLNPAELLPVVRTVLAVSGCRLLVFGCGNDSQFWETVNAGGTTAIVEDDSACQETTRPKLTSSIIARVQYRTRVGDWPAYLDAGDALLLDLPDDIKKLSWDVILVDGPAGDRDDLPGRAQSIVTARRLVAPGGKIFVHDCDRPLEREFCARYLGEQRRFVSIRGRAILNGYSF